jgi:hypothetical protein
LCKADWERWYGGLGAVANSQQKRSGAFWSGGVGATEQAGWALAAYVQRDQPYLPQKMRLSAGGAGEAGGTVRGKGAIVALAEPVEKVAKIRFYLKIA